MRRRFVLAGAGGAAAVLLGIAAVFVSRRAATPPIPPQITLASDETATFDDEFDALSLWNGTTGTWRTTYPYVSDTGAGGTQTGDGELEWYINNRFPPTSSVVPWVVRDGVLSLVADRASPSIRGQIKDYRYTSGMLDSYPSFSQEYGYFEMRAKTPSGQGMWSAFWLLPKNGSWPPEIDIMEVLGKDPATVHTTVHTGKSNVSQGQANKVADTSGGFHTYAVDWEADFITWYFDDRPIYRIATPADLHQPMYMLVNLAVGGAWPGDPDATTPLPSHLDIDWIRVYRSNPHRSRSDAARTVLAARGWNVSPP